MNKIELLAPAGDLEKLKMAILYGADAVYIAGENFGLRTASKNFTEEQMREAVDFVKKWAGFLNEPRPDALSGLTD